MKKNFKGYEIVNIENLPSEGPALLIMYHASSPIDVAFFISKYFIEKKRKILVIVDRITRTIPGEKKLHFTPHWLSL